MATLLVPVALGCGSVASNGSGGASAAPGAPAALAAGSPARAHDGHPGPQVGELAPEFALLDQRANTVELAALLAKGPVAIVFFRSADW